MHIQTLRAKTARTLATGFLAATQGRHRTAAECVDGALLGLIELTAQGAEARDLIDRAERLEHRLTRA